MTQCLHVYCYFSPDNKVVIVQPLNPTMKPLTLRCVKINQQTLITARLEWFSRSKISFVVFIWKSSIINHENPSREKNAIKKICFSISPTMTNEKLQWIIFFRIWISFMMRLAIGKWKIDTERRVTSRANWVL